MTEFNVDGTMTYPIPPEGATPPAETLRQAEAIVRGHIGRCIGEVDDVAPWCSAAPDGALLCASCQLLANTIAVALASHARLTMESEALLARIKIAALEAGAAALTEARAEIAELTTAYNELVKAEAKAYDDGHADAKRQAEAERDEAQADLDALLGHHAATERDYATWRARAEAAQAEIARLEARCGELWSGLYGWSTKYEAAESLITEARAEISRLEKLCGELCDAHEAQFIRAETAEAERARLLHGDDGGPEV